MMQTRCAAPNLLEACTRGDLEGLYHLLHTGSDVAGQATSCKNHDQTAPLTIAIDQGHFDIVRCLLDAGADPRLVPTALPTACWEGNTGMVRDLLGAGAPPDSEDTTGSLPLHIAATIGHTGIVESLLAHGARVDSEDGFGHTALHKAAYGGHVGVLQALLRAGAGDVAPSARDTPLHAACDRGHLPVVSLLLATRNNNVHTPDAEGETPLHRACHGGYADLVRHLVDAGADVHSMTSDGRTCLHLACDCRCSLSISALLEKIDQDTIDPKHTDEFTCYCSHTTHNATEVVEILLAQGLDVNVTDENSQTALHLAARLNNVAIVELLLQAGAHVGATNKYLETALHLASDQGRYAVVRCLVENAADLRSVTFYTATALDLAFHKYNSSRDMLRTLHYLTRQGCPLLEKTRNHVHSNNWVKYALLVWAGGFLASSEHILLRCLQFALHDNNEPFYRLLAAARPQHYSRNRRAVCDVIAAARSEVVGVGDGVLLRAVTSDLREPCSLYVATVGAVRDHITRVSNGNSIIPQLESLTGIVSRSVSDDLLLFAHMRTILPEIFDC